MPQTDRSLVARARAGDTVAFAALLERHRAGLARACGDRDLAQDAALVAWLQLDRLRDPERFGAWLAGIGRLLSLRALRERRPELTKDGAVPDQAADKRDEPVERVLARERAHELASAIASLPPGQRDAIVLFHLGDLPQAAVADRLGTGPRAVSTRPPKAPAAPRAPPTPQEPPLPPKEPLVHATIRDIRRTPANRYVIILAAGDDELPIWIGKPEAEALVAGVRDVELPRPNAHALALSLLAAVDRSASAVRICKLEVGIFYAEVVLDDGTKVDARPSDALVLAVAAGLPIQVDPAVLEAAGPPDEYTADLAESTVDAEQLAGELRAHMSALAEELTRHAENR